VDVVEDSVDAETNESDVALRLHMDVGSPLVEGVRQHAVEGGHHRLRRRIHLDGRTREEFLVSDVDGRDPALGELRLGGFEGALQVVEAFVHHLDVGARGDDELDLEPGELLEIAQGGSVEGIRDGEGHRGPVLGDRAHCVLPCERRRKGAGDHIEVEIERIDLQVGQVGLAGDRLRDLVLAVLAEPAESGIFGELLHLDEPVQLLFFLRPDESLTLQDGDESRNGARLRSRRGRAPRGRCHCVGSDSPDFQHYVLGLSFRQ
jgi:hypothetical protein